MSAPGVRPPFGSLSGGLDGEGVEVVGEDSPAGPGSGAVVASEPTSAHPVAAFEVADAAFVAGAVRFGPVRVGIPRERRSPLEHVKALATALAAARGHDVAIASLVRGLRRRLQARTGTERGAAVQEPWPVWAARLQQGARNTELRERASALSRFAAGGQPDSAVRDAANAVEDVWEALHR